MTILEILERKLMPWVREQGVHRLVVADPATLEAQELPEGMVVRRQKLRGRRVAVKGSREYGNRCNTVARWPEDKLEEELIPFIICVVSGQVTLQVADRLIECSEGHFLLIPPRVPYSSGDREVVLKTGRVPDMMAFQIWDDHLQCGLFYAIGTSLFTSNAALIQLLDLLQEEALSRRGGSAPIVADLFSAFLAMFHRELADGRCFGQNSVVLGPPGQTASGDPIQRVQRYVRSNLGQPLTIELAATLALMSRSQFIKRFREATGQSFIQYVNNCRLEEVKMLLRETDWTVNAIHKFVGYKDATYLRRIFHEQVGMSFMEYRHHHRKTDTHSED